MRQGRVLPPCLLSSWAASMTLTAPGRARSATTLFSPLMLGPPHQVGLTGLGEGAVNVTGMLVACCDCRLILSKYTVGIIYIN
jgi:hypothetical protein